MSIMEPLVMDEAVSAVLEERDWEGGIDNDGLDISQLESYINDDNNETMYFEALQSSGGGGGVTDIKTLATTNTTTTRDTPSSRLHHLHHHNHHHHQTPSIHHQPHLPDSPPDSGSEPYSPPDHPSLSPQQTSGGLSDIYTRPPGGGGGVPAFPYTVLGTTPQSLPSQQQQQQQPPPPQQQQQQSHHLTPLQPAALAYHQQQQQQQSIMLGGTSPHAGCGGAAPPVYGQPREGVAAAKKQRMTDGSGRPTSMVSIKQEPELVVGVGGNGTVATVTYGEDDDYTTDSTGAGPFLDGSYQCIRFQNFQQHTWSLLCNADLKELPLPTFRVDADKGFNFSNPDEAFVCQKKNHFQVTAHVQATGEPVFVKSSDGLQKVDRFMVHFFGVKTESPSQMIRVEQSQSDRSKKAFHPVIVDMKSEQGSKITVGRLHFSETTSNNMRKKGKPNPDQRYFYLVVALKAHCGENAYPIAAHASEKIIVRASNPGQFESDVEYTFQRGSYPESIFHMGRVGINTDRPDEALVIHGNLKITGQLLQPSDRRAKKDVSELDTREQLKNVQNLRVVKYAYRKEFAEQAGMEGDAVYDTGVIAQEVKEVIPDAVKSTGGVTLSNGEKIDNFLLVNKERIFMENVGAVKELCKVTGNLENRIDELEIMNKKISQLRRFESFKSTTSSVSTRTSGTATSRVSSVCQRGRSCSKRGKSLGHSSSQDEGWCSNKMLQVTTITLVCIMAFCLMAMATIYILDYHERRQETSPTLPSTATTVMLSPSMTSPSTPASTPDHYTASTLTSLFYTPTTASPTTTTTPVPPLPVPPILGRPEDCPNTAPSEDPVCHEFCCSSSVTLQLGVMSQPGPSYTTPATSITITRRIFHYDQTTVPPTMSRYGEVITNKLSTSDPNTVNDSTTQAGRVFKPMPSKKSVSIDQMARLARLRARMNRPSSSRSIKQTLSKRSIHSKRSTSNSHSQYMSQMNANDDLPIVRIMELNMTVNHLYCLNSSDSYRECLSSQAKNLTYGFPISRFMPHANLTLHFGYQTDGFNRQPSFCASCNDSQTQYPDEQCHDSSPVLSPNDVIEVPGETPRDYYVTLVNVGRWYQVGYKFRISLIPGEQDPCTFDADTIGDQFSEFNFIFKRMCTS